MKLRPLLFFLLFLLTAAWAGAVEDLYFSGYLADSRHMNMYLRINENSLSGWYCFTHEGTLHPLAGYPDEMNDIWLLQEIDENNQKEGLFRGHLEDRSLTGLYKGREEELSFDLTLRIEMAELELSLADKIIISRQFPHFVQNDEKAAFNDFFYDNALQAANEFYQFSQTMKSPPESYISQQRMNLAYLGDQWVSLIFDSYEYSGGAHGNSYWKCMNYRKEGEQWVSISLKDFLRSSEMSGALIKKVLQDLSLQGAAWANDPRFLDSASLLKNFTVSPMGITFHFEPYMVGPYSQGSYETLISWDEPFWDEENLADLPARESLIPDL